MGAIKEGDIVTRNSYGNDIFFKVVNLFETEGRAFARLKGLDLRLEANAPLADLKKVDQIHVSQYWHKTQLQNMEKMRNIFVRRDDYRKRALGRATNSNSAEVESFDMPGTLVHLDGDRDYLDMCMTSYKQLNIECHGYHIDEEKQAAKVIDLLTEHRPDMLVLTGHDGLVKGAKEADYRDIKKYHNSQHFINAVRAARLYEKSLDDLIIFAGACQSHYEALLASGANFASSPRRVLINAYDPVFVMEKVAYTSIYDPVPLKDVIASTITGFDGIGGVERTGALSVKYKPAVLKRCLGVKIHVLLLNTQEDIHAGKSKMVQPRQGIRLHRVRGRHRCVCALFRHPGRRV